MSINKPVNISFKGGKIAVDVNLKGPAALVGFLLYLAACAAMIFGGAALAGWGRQQLTGPDVAVVAVVAGLALVWWGLGWLLIAPAKKAGQSPGDPA